MSGLSANLTEKEILAGGERMTLPLKSVQATHARDALIKHVYVRVFEHYYVYSMGLSQHT